MSSMERFTKWFRSARQRLHRGEDRATFEINPILSASPGLSTFTAGAKTPSQEFKGCPVCGSRFNIASVNGHAMGERISLPSPLSKVPR